MEQKYDDLVNSIKQHYEELGFTLSHVITALRNELSNCEYSKLNKKQKANIDAKIGLNQSYVALRIKMLLLEELIQENQLSISYWQWPIIN